MESDLLKCNPVEKLIYVNYPNKQAWEPWFSWHYKIINIKYLSESAIYN